MNYKKMPKQEEVSEFELGNSTIKLVEITDENRDYLLEIITAQYMDDECMYCHRKFTFDEVKKSVVAKPNKFGRIVHKECWDTNNP